MKKVLVSILLIISFVACGGSKPEVSTSSKPLSHQVSFIESSSSAEIMLRAVGFGKSIAEANRDAMRAAVWFALRGGDNPLLQTKQERKKFSQIQEKIYKNVAKYIAYDSGIKGKKKTGNTYNITHVYRVNIAMLKEDLTDMGVLSAVEDIFDDMDLPVVAVVAQGNNKEAIQSVGVISEYLNDLDFEVKRLIGGSVDKIFLKIAQSIAVDPIAAQMYANALSSGSDIYITTNVSTGSRRLGSDEVKKAAVVLRAYYTATGKEIGATTGYSQERVVSSYSSIIAEATNDASNKILNQIKKSWKKESKKGKYYKVIVTSSSDLTSKINMPIYQALKDSCKRVKPNQEIGNIFDYTLQCKKVNNYKELFMEIKANYKGAGNIYLDAAKGSFIVIKVAYSESDEIIIE